ncbi:MAG: putative baseplate assembly protein [Gammaproteobacteria bacterium]|nr:putative baseplate assembly protein [Gammaproteobacteria bacterium]
MNSTELTCRNDRRRHDVRQAPLFGLDFVEVDLSADHATLEIFFLGKAPPQIQLANVRITGGRRLRDLWVKEIHVHRQEDPTLDDYLEVVVTPAGDASTYTLRLVKLDADGHPTDDPMDDFDPRYAEVDFTFRAGCPTDLDCKTPATCPPPQREQPDINYLAKDFDSFRQLILDRLALTMPDWRETHAPDIGVALVEVLAYAGDYLSYYQDAVATEAYLGTARQRISVRRHARLVDYFMHEGCNARAWVTIATDIDAVLDARNIFFVAGLPSPDMRLLQADQFAQLAPGQYELFESLVKDATSPIQLYAAHSEIHFYTWGDCACCLPVGATSAALIDQWVSVNPVPSSPTLLPGGEGRTNPSPVGRGVGVREAVAVGDENAPPGTKRALNLQVGDVLIFEEIVGPTTGNPADADPRHRQAVRLTKVTRTVDPLYHPYREDYGQPLVDIEWCSEDALTFPLCISATLPAPDCDCRANLSVARGNVILVDSGFTIGESLGEVPAASRTDRCATACEPPDSLNTPAKFQPILAQRPLTFAQPLPDCGCAVTFGRQDPRLALPRIWLIGTQPSAQGAVVTSWTAKQDLLSSGGTDPHFVVEMDDDGYAHLRFGDGNLGARPNAGTAFQASYRLGNGAAGNVGADAIRCIVFRQMTDGIGNLQPRNPLPARGGTVRESVEDVKMFAPFAFRNVLERAITAADYAALVADNARRLSERPALLAAANALPLTTLAPHDQPHDPRAAIEEEPGEAGGLDTDACLIPFQPLQGARGTLRWNGSWYEALVAVDPVGRSGGDEIDDELLNEIDGYLQPYRRIGHDLDVRRAEYVPIDLVLSVCVKPSYQRGHVESALLDVFSNRVLADGRLGFFHPDSLSFGVDIYISRIVAAAQAVAGVLEVHVSQLERFDPGEPVPDMNDELPADGKLALGPFEIARLDNDPSFPENGRLLLMLRGGR